MSQNKSDATIENWVEEKVITLNSKLDIIKYAEKDWKKAWFNEYRLWAKANEYFEVK